MTGTTSERSERWESFTVPVTSFPPRTVPFSPRLVSRRSRTVHAVSRTEGEGNGEGTVHDGPGASLVMWFGLFTLRSLPSPYAERSARRP